MTEHTPSSADSSSPQPIRRVLISVYDKTGLSELGRDLSAAGVEIVSTGSTARTLLDAGVTVTAVDDVTGFAECLDGRVKTLHPRIHAGILADRRRADHREQLSDLAIEPFDLIVVNLYPFAETVASGAARDEAVEQIDIGGPAMVRAAAKNHDNVAVVVSPGAYEHVREALAFGGFSIAARRRLAAEAFAHTASYDTAVASWFAAEEATEGEWAAFDGLALRRRAELRYGENPHQRAALYADGSAGPASAEQLHGKEMSYNNYVDADAAWRAAFDHHDPCVAIIKHANPCGIALGGDIAEAHRRAHACDPTSAFGGVIASNREVSADLAAQVAEVFTEVLIAPSYGPGALEVLQQKKNVRLLRCEPPAARGGRDFRPVAGGVLAQQRDALDASGDDVDGWTMVAGEPADDATLADLAFAWRAVRAVKSNAILLASGGGSVGIGMGQVNRVDSCRLAVDRAGTGRAQGAVAASDAFFPFADGPQVLMDAGVRAIVQPGGSVRDSETIAAATAAGVSMYVTGTRHFAH